MANKRTRENGLPDQEKTLELAGSHYAQMDPIGYAEAYFTVYCYHLDFGFRLSVSRKLSTKPPLKSKTKLAGKLQ